MKIDVGNIFYIEATPKILLASFVLIFSYLIFSQLSYKNLTTEDTLITPNFKAPQEQVYSGLKIPIFGTYQDELSADMIKKSMIQLEIVGIIYGEDNNQSQVMIRTANGEDKIFKLHDKINDNIEIIKILQDRIIVKRNNVLESLHMPQNQLDYGYPEF